MIMLDTHVLVWWVSGDFAKLSDDAQAHLSRERSIGAGTQSQSIIVSSISALEVAQLVDRERLDLAMDLSSWLATAETIPGIVFVPVDNEIAVKSVQLPGVFHKDPADRIIVATARKYGVPLVTMDRKIHAYPHVQTIW
jgi:PIN domain nuclease of toxin-antitoxin system